MTEADKIRALVDYRMEQADEALQSTATNLAAGLARSAANRAYYAMFYAVLALLATEKKETSKHSAAISLFDRHFVKAAALPRELSRWLHEAFALRQQADYSPDQRVSLEQATAVADHAKKFVERVRTLLVDRIPTRADLTAADDDQENARRLARLAGSEPDLEPPRRRRPHERDD